jgi:hypothetical protein
MQTHNTMDGYRHGCKTVEKKNSYFAGTAVYPCQPGLVGPSMIFCLFHVEEVSSHLLMICGIKDPHRTFVERTQRKYIIIFDIGTA